MCRAIITAHNCLLFDPQTPQSKKFLEIVTPRLTASEGARALAEYKRSSDDYEEDEALAPPFELEMIEGAMMVATGNLITIYVSCLVLQVLCVLLGVTSPFSCHRHRLKYHCFSDHSHRMLLVDGNSDCPPCEAAETAPHEPSSPYPEPDDLLTQTRTVYVEMQLSFDRVLSL